MKKSLLAVLIAAAFISGCEDSAMTQKLLSSENTVVQLGNEVNTLKADLAKKEAEIAELTPLKEENAKLKSELEKAQQHSALQVEIVKIFDKSDVVKHKVDPKDEYAREETTVSSFVSLPKTNMQWLNQLLINEAYVSNEEQEKTAKNLSEDEFKKHREDVHQGLIKMAKEEPVIGYDDMISSSYLGQRNNIATFTQLFYSYMGGAHGLEHTRYINVDLNKQAIIRLNDLVPSENQATLKNILWTNYSSARLNENGKYEGFANQNDFRISEEFYFTPYGITFVYPPYELGPYVEGEVEVDSGWYEINDLLNPEYQRSEKDGFYPENGE